MRKLLLILVFVLIGTSMLYSWGFWAHKQINKTAIFTLPSGMFGFYKLNVEYLTEQAVGPDKRRYTNAEEAPRHYLDADHYGIHAFDSLPISWTAAVSKYSEDTLKTYGIVPWHIYRVFLRLTEAFKNQDEKAILRLSADLGHYVADAHVPLHTTENYNGQLSNQVGIHGFWEARVPELLGDQYDYFIGKAIYIEKPQLYAWEIIRSSHELVDSVLTEEKTLNAEFPPDKKYSYEQRGGSLMKVYSEDYTLQYNNRLNDMAERRMREAILAVGSYWYTAWVNAGQPDLQRLQLKKQEVVVEEGDTTNKGTHISKGHND